MPDVFVSYSRADQGRVRRIVEALEKQGWSVWWDPNIMPGERYAQTIDAELKSAKCVLAVWSELSAQSDWVQEEAEDGKTRGVLLPVLIDDIPIPRGFRRVQTVDLSDWDGNPKHTGWQYVIAAAKRFVQGGPIPQIKLPKTRRQKRAALIANIVSAAALVVIAGGVWWGVTHPAQVQQITQSTFIAQIINIFTGGGNLAANGGENAAQAGGVGEPNDTIDTAQALRMDRNVSADIGAEGDVDFYRTSVGAGPRNMVTFRLDAEDPLRPDLVVYNGRQEEVARQYLSTPGGAVEATVSARPGETLYARAGAFAGGAGAYRLSVANDTTHALASNFAGAARETEPNDTAFQANELAWGRPLLGFATDTSDSDFYSVTAPSGAQAPAQIVLRAGVPTYRGDLVLLDARREQVLRQYTTTAGADVVATFTPEPGATYYLKVGVFSTGFGDYVLEIGAAP